MSDPHYGQVCPKRRAGTPGGSLPHAQPSAARPSPRGPSIDLEALKRFLQRRYHYNTPESVAADTGIPPETVRNWIRLRARPSIGNFLTLALHYGPDLVAAAWPGAPRWMDSACREEEAARLEAEQERINRRLKELRS